MLKPAEMRRLRIVTLEEHVDGTIKRIEKSGNVHLTDIKEVLGDWDGLIEPSKADDVLMKSSALLERMDNIIAMLRPPEVKRGIKERLFKEPEEVERVEVEERRLEDIENEFELIEKVVNKSTKEYERLKLELEKTKEVYEILKVLKELGIDLAFIGKKEFIFTYVGKLASRNVEELRRIFEEATAGKNYFIASKEIPPLERGKEQTFAVVVVLKKDKEEIERALSMVDFEIWIPPADIPEKTKEAIGEFEARIKQLEGEIKENGDKIEEIKRDKFKDLLVMRELVQIEESKEKTKILFGKTKRLRVIEGWTPKEEAIKVVEELREEVGEFGVIEEIKPKREDARVPSLITNPSIIKPFESIVKMYSPPSYKEIDPTIIIAIIFPILFGFMFPDIGHGFIVLLLGLALMFAFRGLGKGLREMGTIIVLCGLCSMIVGALFGEFFGFSEYAAHLVEESLHIPIPHWLIFKPLWFEPIPNAKFMFVVSMLIGAMHMGLGLFLNAANNFSNRNIIQGISGFIKIWCLFGALYFLLLLFGFFFTELKYGNIQLLLKNATIFIALPVILLTSLKMFTELRHGEGGGENEGESEGYGHSGEKKKRMSVMDLPITFIDGVIDALLENFFRFLANTVSYGRILALALCHAALIEVFVLLSFMCLKLNVVVGAIVFLGGTAIVIILEALMAGIHAIRLHFYEWFTKFYEGGGVEFSPFKLSRTYTY